MKRALVVLAVVALAAAVSAWAAPGDRMGQGRGGPGAGPRAGRGLGLGGAPFHDNLFPPDLVLRNQTALGLTAEQTAAVKDAIKESQGQTLDLQVEVHRLAEQLDGVLEPSKVDQAAALAAADALMTLEARIKRVHLVMLIRVKNTLTPDQLSKLRTLRPPQAEAPAEP